MTATIATQHPTGIASIGLHFPPLALPVEVLARLRGLDPRSYAEGIGYDEMSLTSPDYGVAELAAEAARRALDRWGGALDRIGMVAVGSESPNESGRPLSAWLADRLGLRGSVRTYEVGHDSYGGTLAVRQATEWRLSGAAQDKAALVVAAEASGLSLADDSETSGAGAVAMIIDRPDVALIQALPSPWSEPGLDFRLAPGRIPRLDGPLTLEHTRRAAEHCFQALAGKRNPEEVMAELTAICFSLPVPRLVKNAVFRVGEFFGWGPDTIEDFLVEKVNPTMLWNRLCGNAHGANLWISVAQALQGRARGEKIAAFSFGSGFGADLLMLEAGPKASEGAWADDVARDLEARRRIDLEGYRALQAMRAWVG